MEGVSLLIRTHRHVCTLPIVRSVLLWHILPVDTVVIWIVPLIVNSQYNDLKASLLREWCVDGRLMNILEMRKMKN